MKTFAILALLLALMLSGCSRAHHYQIERVKDVAGNEAFLRIDIESGTECAVGHGYAVVRESAGDPEKYIVPFCDWPKCSESQKQNCQN